MHIFGADFRKNFNIYTSTHLTFVVKADMALMAIWLSVTVTWRVADTWKEPGSARRHVSYIAAVFLLELPTNHWRCFHNHEEGPH